jgi:diguanylate cyclase (GGDEF)-like protein
MFKHAPESIAVNAVQRRAEDAVPAPADDPWDAPLKPPSLPLAVRLPLMAAASVASGCAALATVLSLTTPQWRPHPAIAIALGTLVGGALCALVIRAMARRLTDRLDQVVEVLQHATSSDYTMRVDTLPGDDTARLAYSVNRLVSSSKERHRNILESALADPLTGLPNRTLLTERLRHMLALSKRQPTPFAIAVIDLDRFKFVNDTLGHAAGDSVLVEVGRRLRQVVRESDTVARLGGDEFVLLLTGGEETVCEVANRIIESMKVPLQLEQSIDIGLSIGIALHPQHGADDRTLMRHADSAMYRAKRRRGGVEIFNGEIHEVRGSYLSMLGELRTALESGQFVLEYQPKLDVATSLIVAFEGLVRWKHPTRGTVQPGEFVQFAEQSGFIRELSLWVVAEGAKFARELSRQGLDIAISVNVSAQDIERPEFAERIARIVRDTAPPPDQLCLEITESGLVSETDIAVANLKAVAKLGVRLAVDDFGTGYATLKQLQSLPVQELKIDRSFVSGMNENRGSYTIVRSTIDLGKQLGLRVVAEGVETVAELRSLAALGCDEIQGYYVSKPMPASEVAKFVRSRNALQDSTQHRYAKLAETV